MERKFVVADEQSSTTLRLVEHIPHGARGNNVREAILRELEKEKIREEVMAVEADKRRLLEAQVRLDMLMERERIALSLTRIDKLLFQLNGDIKLSEAKPDTNLPGEKRKAVTPPAVGPQELPVIGSNKKPKEDWSCAICQISTTSEQGLKEHLQGKKHRAKEAGLGTKSAKKDKSLLQKNQDADDLEKKRMESKKDKFEFWCDVCQKGTHTEIVMTNHKMGKKHIARVEKLNEDGGNVLETQMVKEHLTD